MDDDKTRQKIYKLSFSGVYPLYVTKVQKKGRTQAEVDAVICWLSGYSQSELEQHAKHEITFEAFFKQAPRINPNATKITGQICGVRVEEIKDPIVQQVRYLDKLVDELAKGRPLEKILRI